MKNINKKIICLFASIFISICCIASIVSFIFTGNLSECYSFKHPFKSIFSYTYSMVNTVLDKDYVLDSEANVLRLKNNYLAYQNYRTDLTIAESKITNLNNFLKENNIKYTHLITSESGDERLGQLPNGYETNYCEETTTNYINFLNKNNINYINAYDILTNAPNDYYYYFYKTDHHWNDYAGIYLSQIISNYLNEKYNYNLDSSLYNIENYELVKYKNLFLGSYGKKVGLSYASPEDFDMLIPKYQTNFKTTKNKNGSYLDALIHKDKLKKDYLNINPYSAYLGGDHGLIEIENLINDNGLKVLILKDSKANIISTHLASSFQHLEIIDPRHYKKDIKNYIKKSKPDLVISIFSPFNSESFYENF